MTLQIEEGKFYRSRQGDKWGPVHPYDSHNYPWKAKGPDGREEEFTDQEFYYSSREDPDDLVTEWVDEPEQPIGPARTVTRKEIVMGQYGYVIVNQTGVSGKSVKTGLEFRFHEAAELRDAARIFNELADALENPDA